MGLSMLFKIILDQIAFFIVGWSRSHILCLEEVFSNCEKLVGNRSEKLVNENPKKLISGEKIIPFEIEEKQEENIFQKMLNKIKWKKIFV